MQNRVKLAALIVVAVVAFDSRAASTNQAKTVHLVSRIVAKDFLSETIRIGDLNRDGAPDFLFVQNLYGPRTITCLTATTLAGELLWQTGKPSKDNGRAYCDLPAQIYDWDRDGNNEVLYVRQAVYLDSPPAAASVIRERAPRYEGEATMVVLDGRTGQEKTRFPLPAAADDTAVTHVILNWPELVREGRGNYRRRARFSGQRAPRARDAVTLQRKARPCRFM